MMSIILCALLLSGTAWAQGLEDQEVQVVRDPWVSDPVEPFVINVDLRDLPIQPLWRPGDPIKEIPRRHNTKPLDTSKPQQRRDPLLDLQSAAETDIFNEAFSTTQLNFDGQGYSGVNPPDTVGDVGMQYYIQSINSGGGATFVVYDKDTGQQVAGPFNMDSFGSGNCGSGLGDPVILYDRLAERWMISEFASGSNVLCVYVSQTSDPVSGGWYAYAFPTPSFPDYPKYSVWPDAYYVGTNESQPTLYALDRQAMLNGQPATSQRFTTSGLSGFGFQMITPADMDGAQAPPSGSPGIFMRHRDDEVHGGGNGSSDSLEIFEFNVDWNTPSNSSLVGPFSLSISEFDSSLCGLTSFSCFPQPGSSTTLDPLREVVMWRLQYRNFGSHETLIGNFVTDVNGNDRGGIRWFELRRQSGGDWSLYQEGTFSPDTDNRWMGGISMDGNGNIALAYNVSSGSTAPSLRYTGRLASDPLGTLPQGEHNIVSGSAANGSNRYGDYSSMNVDPETDCTFWFTGQYNTSSSWSTRIASFGFESCSGCDNPPAAPTGLSVAVNGNNRLDLSWNAVSGASSYRVYRAEGSCPQSNFSLIATDVSGTGYSDTNVSGGVTYAYVVTAYDSTDSCESDQSACDDAKADGACTTPPSFDGLASVTSPGSTTCQLDLAWSAATANCGGSVSYNIYRSTQSGFTPAPANRIAACLGGTSYSDFDVASGTVYYYVVRAEDDTSDGSGPCNSGNEDGNTEEQGAAPAGPQTVFLQDDLESGDANWNIDTLPGDGGNTDPWFLATSDSNSPSTSFFVSDEATVKDQAISLSAALDLPAGSPAALSFFHRYDTESTYDGGVLEYSTDDGANWFDILAGNGGSVPANGDRITQNGYNSTISTSYSSPIGGRSAWSGNSSGFQEVTVDLSDMGGTSLLLRWRLACDTSVSANGWWVDDVTVSAASDCGGTPCSYSISPTSADVAGTGGTGSVAVTTEDGCSWTATSNAGWLTITSGSSGSGSGSVSYSAAANAGNDARTGTLTIAGQTFTVNQAAGNQAPSVSLDAPADNGRFNPGEAITFSGSASDPEDGDISADLSWSSSLDGTFGSGAQVTVDTLSVGAHTITLSVTDSAGASAQASISLTINAPPQADFTFQVDGLAAAFTDASSDSDGSIASHDWDFGDNNGSSQANPSHSYAAPGTYTVTLTVTDNDGAQGSTSAQVTVSDDGVTVIENGQTVSGLAGAQGDWLYFKIIVPDGARDLTIQIEGGSGDADLYTRFGDLPTTSEYDCRPYRNGNSETCSYTAPQAGEYFIGLRGYRSFSDVSLSASYSEGGDGDGFSETDLAAGQGDWIRYTIEVPAGRTNLAISIFGGSGDADVYVRYGSAPTTDDWDYRPYLNGNSESVDVANPQAGTWHIGIRGYRAFSGLTLDAYHFP
ncbi:pre-peptidase C-terminal domain-containing protein [Sulfidibacter corallicola]|uniref:Pre-peptidase C-terminal domain-containing protein n=1 Tax=Sulfidibacter corallicola TaxID=2818388 RepID=A0A8A4TRB9_SULCO|nr:pre-peptidase C-terminal domain-containing protein [Sulfidibacter corallicola]QTD52063.1 pre-peptidase C-terminal domain-containing protein [Sulfidibacter corallicola]